MKRVPNAEQQAAIRASKTGRMLVIDALAGTGKTSTLEEIAAANPYWKYLYLAFNASAKEDARARFGRNVRAMTTHGMVFMEFGRRFDIEKRKLNAPRMGSRKIASILGITTDLRIEWCVTCGQEVKDDSHHGHAIMAETLEPRTLASLAMRTVDRWCHSADPSIKGRHVPRQKGLDTRMHDAVWRRVVPHAWDAWEDLRSPEGELKFSHDMYLKMAQVSGWRPAETRIMLDEAQDTNPCTAALVFGPELEGLPGRKYTVVGDPNQQIYEWRGAQDVMSLVEPDQRLSLTGSYRFGPEVAEEANLYLEALGTDLRLRGWKRKEEVTGRPTRVVSKSDVLEDAILCRSNSGAIVEAMRVLDMGRTAALVGGGEPIQRLAEGAIDLMQGRRSEHPDLITFESWAEVQRYCKEEPEDAGTLVPLVKAVDEHGPYAIMDMTKRLLKDGEADVTISTGHKAKGRQWRTVRIAEDWPRPGEGRELGTEETRLAYVAVTRAEDLLIRGSLDYMAA